ncbi:MAG: hypothetical protein OSW77_15120 [Proteobacteria bacterium]|nr:hypothetical protein [Pseudomonadota bacterium]
MPAARTWWLAAAAACGFLLALVGATGALLVAGGEGGPDPALTREASIVAAAFITLAACALVFSAVRTLYFRYPRAALRMAV